jgi:hypothetical protein
LDDFNRADGVLGTRWAGPTSEFEIANSAVRYTTHACGPMYWAEAFGVEQEAFVTLSTIDPTAYETFIALKAQTLGPCEVIEVLYMPVEGTVGVHTCTEGAWTEHETPAAFEEGDQLGARALPSGIVEVYKNGTLVFTAETPEFPYHAQGGRIGLGCWPSQGQLGFDDFGGG